MDETEELCKGNDVEAWCWLDNRGERPLMTSGFLSCPKGLMEVAVHRGRELWTRTTFRGGYQEFIFYSLDSVFNVLLLICQALL